MFLRFLATLGLNASGYETGWKRAESVADRSSKRIASAVKGQLAAMFGAAAIGAAIKNTVDYGARMKELSIQLNATTDEVQELAFAFEQESLSVEALATTIATLNRARKEALRGSENKKSVLENVFGLSPSEIRNGNAVDLFRRIGNVVRSGRIESSRLGGALQEIFSETGERLIPVFNAGLDETGKLLRDLGGIVSEEKIDQLKRTSGELTNIKAALRGLAAEAGPATVGILERLTSRIKEANTSPIRSILRSIFGDLVDLPGGGAGSIGQAGALNDGLKRGLSAAQRAAARRAGAGQPENFPGLGGFGQFQSVANIARILSAGKLTGGLETLINPGQLAAIGGFIGAGGTRNVQANVQKLQLSELKKIREAAQRMARETSL